MPARIWLFDLDNTLHNASAHIFPHINRAMTAYMARHLDLSLEAAGDLRMRYWQRYGATLSGLMRHHRIAPRHFLHHTHQFPDLAAMLVFDPRVRHMLRRLPGQRVIFSNAPRHYAREIVRLAGLRGVFSHVLGIEDLNFRPKPHPASYRSVLRRIGARAGQCTMIEDTLANLRPAHRLGMRTVWINAGSQRPAWVSQRLKAAHHLRA